MRIWISRLLVAVMLANLAVWSSPDLAEAMERLVTASQPADLSHEAGADQCKHGCASHCGSHVQWVAAAIPVLPVAPDAYAVARAADSPPASTDLTLPFRPPLGVQLT